MTIVVDVPFVIIAVGIVSFLCGVAFMMLRKVEATRCDISISRVSHDVVEFEVEVFVDGQKYTQQKYIRGDSLMSLLGKVIELNAARANTKSNDEQKKAANEQAS